MTLLIQIPLEQVWFSHFTLQELLAGQTLLLMYVAMAKMVVLFLLIINDTFLSRNQEREQKEKQLALLVFCLLVCFWVLFCFLIF